MEIVVRTDNDSDIERRRLQRLALVDGFAMHHTSHDIRLLSTSIANSLHQPEVVVELVADVVRQR